MPQNYEKFPREVRERFDIVSWDPRGIGNSTAVDCFGSPEAAAEWAGGHAVGFPVGARERATWIAAYRDLSRRCERRNPELLRHVSTADTARDLDGLRRAVGDSQLTYLGISYGTFLGATYANLFPAAAACSSPRYGLGSGTGGAGGSVGGSGVRPRHRSCSRRASSVHPGWTT